MRAFLEARVRGFASRWLFWGLVLLALPNCEAFDAADNPPPHLTAGDPRTSAIMCDIEKYQGPTRRCANAQDLRMGVPLTAAAEALVAGEASNVGLDYSPAALSACGGAVPQAVDFRGPFPDGYAVCVNCGVMPTPHADVKAVCVAACQDLVTSGGGPTPPDKLAFCQANARPSTHFPLNGCYDNACTTEGTLRSDFVDPRWNPEPVVWRDPIGTTAAGSNLTQVSPTTTGDTFAAGAVSEQWVNFGDAYVEFHAVENNLSHVVGFDKVSGCAFPCPDTNPGFADIDFGLSLNNDGRVYVLEAGALVLGGNINNSFGTYVAGERFRVRVTDHINGTATVIYTRIIGACLPGNTCNEAEVFKHTTPSPAVFPLRVAAAFREQNATVANVNFVRIQ